MFKVARSSCTFHYFSTLNDVISSTAGTMCSRKSAEAPEFFLHHGFIDKIWADYQSKSRLKKFVFFSTINARMQGIPYKPRRLLDNNNLPGGVRVCYKNPTVNQARKIRVYLNSMLFNQILLALYLLLSLHISFTKKQTV